MKKFVALLVSILTLGLFILVAWWLYRNFHTTPMLIGNLLIILTGVLISFTIYQRLSDDDKNKLIVHDYDYPDIETGLIYAQVNDFVNKYEKKDGKLFIVGIDLQESEFSLQSVEFKKLTDELIFKFKPTLEINVQGVSTVAVGDNQFLLYGFETGTVNYKEKYNFDWKHDKLLLSSKNEKNVEIKIPAQKPTIVFSWS